MRSSRTLVLVMMGILFAPEVASAQAIDVKICARWGTDFLDIDTDPYNDYDDFYTDNPAAGRRANGGLVTVVNDGITRYDGYTAWDGTEPGCTPLFELDYTKATLVWVYSASEVNGNTIVVGSPATYQAFILPGSSLSNGGAANVITSANATWNTMAAASWAMSRRSGGVSGETFLFETGNCPTYPAGTACFQTGSETIYTGGTTRKHIIVHEMGHALAYYAAGSGPNYSYTRNNTHLGCQSSTASLNPPGPHAVDSEEFQGAAAVEGFADFYSSMAFNDSGDSDCWRQVSYPVNWDDDNDNENAWYSCNGPEPGGSNDKDFWWWGSDGASATRTCNEPADDNFNLGTQYDWNRHLWDLHSEQGLTGGNIYDIYAASNPNLWLATGALPSHIPTAPSWELWDAADDLGFQTEWEAEWDNGPLR